MVFPPSHRLFTLLVLVGLSYACTCSRDEMLPLPFHGPQLMSHEKLQARRAELLEREIAEYKKCPDCYRQRVVGTTRALKFDAIADCA